MTLVYDRADMLEELRVIEVGCVPVDDYSEDPNGWLDDYLNEYAWKIQRDIWLSVVHNRATAVLSCNNSGKTWLAARIVVWWILTHWRHGVRVVTTAPTAAQVSLLLWQEVRAAYNKAKAAGKPVPGRIIGSPYPQWKIGDVTAGFGRKPSDHEQSAMQGVHAAYVLAVVDEAGGVAQSIFDALDKITTNENARLLLIGNPDDRNAPFGKVTEPGSGWNVIQIDGLRTPNFTREALESGKYPLTRALMRHEGIPYNTETLPVTLEESMRKHLLSPLWVEERFQRWCGVQPEVLERMEPAALGQHLADLTAASQLFTAAVRGEFPDTSGDNVIPLGWVRRAQERWSDWTMGDKRRKISPRAEPVGRRIVGVDVATTNGADDTVVAPRQGNVSFELHVHPEGDTHRTAEYALEQMGAVLTQAVAVVDGIGIGRGVADVLSNDHGVHVVSFEAYLQSDRTDRYGEYRFNNDRSAAWWRMRELLHPVTGSNICLPPDPKLEAELTAPTWKVRSSSKGGVIQVESKDEIRKRLGRSTDRADAVIQSYWIDGPEAARDMAARDAGKPAGAAIPWQTPDGGNVQRASGAAAGSGMIAWKLEED